MGFNDDHDGDGGKGVERVDLGGMYETRSPKEAGGKRKRQEAKMARRRVVMA